MRFVSSSENVAQDVILRFCLALPDAQDGILRHTFADEKCILAKAGAHCNCFLWACHLVCLNQIKFHSGKQATASVTISLVIAGQSTDR
jgi:hypothetical protein